MTTDRKLLLSRLHERDVQEALGGRASKSSGNQWNDQADGKHHPYEEFAVGWDCKCVMPTTKSMSISRDDLMKLAEQTGGRVPTMPIRFYASERGRIAHDMILVPLQHYVELRERAGEMERSMDDPVYVELCRHIERIEAPPNVRLSVDGEPSMTYPNIDTDTFGAVWTVRCEIFWPWLEGQFQASQIAVDEHLVSHPECHDALRMQIIHLVQTVWMAALDAVLRWDGEPVKAPR